MNSLGQLGEEYAQNEYRKRGFTIVATNEFNRKGKRLGEIDFVAANSKVVAFVEVKTRATSNGRFGSGFEAVNMFKQVKILRAVKSFLLRNPGLVNHRPQIDVCEIVWSKLDKGPDSVTIHENSVEDWN